MVKMRLPLLPIRLKDNTEVIGLIHGQTPDSKNEYWFSQALEILKIPYIYQYQVGMLGVRGSQKIDFLVLTPGASQACFIQGAHWHNAKTESEDKLKQADAARIFGAGNVKLYTEEQTVTLEAAIAAVKATLI